jgi:hypothetical protein
MIKPARKPSAAFKEKKQTEQIIEAVGIITSRAFVSLSIFMHNEQYVN